MTLCTPSSSRGELFVGFNSGINISGDQDQKFKEYNSQGELVHFYFTKDIQIFMVGTIGEAERMDGTVIADAVNLASRLEGLTKKYGTYILISEYALTKIEDPQKYNYRFLGKVQVKGKQEAVSVFEIRVQNMCHT